MTRHEKIRADIIAAQAAREAATKPPEWPKKKPGSAAPGRRSSGMRFSMTGPRKPPAETK